MKRLAVKNFTLVLNFRSNVDDRTLHQNMPGYEHRIHRPTKWVEFKWTTKWKSKSSVTSHQKVRRKDYALIVCSWSSSLQFWESMKLPDIKINKSIKVTDSCNCNIVLCQSGLHSLHSDQTHRSSWECQITIQWHAAWATLNCKTSIFNDVSYWRYITDCSKSTGGKFLYTKEPCMKQYLIPYSRSNNKPPWIESILLVGVQVLNSRASPLPCPKSTTSWFHIKLSISAGSEQLAMGNYIWNLSFTLPLLPSWLVWRATLCKISQSNQKSTDCFCWNLKLRWALAGFTVVPGCSVASCGKKKGSQCFILVWANFGLWIFADRSHHYIIWGITLIPRSHTWIKGSV